jgi:hypothetical protein
MKKLNLFKYFDNIIITIAMLGIILVFGGIIFFNKYHIYTFIQKTFIVGETDLEKAEEYYQDGLEEIQKWDLSGVKFDFNRLALSCKIYNLLHPGYKGYYDPPWLEKKELWHFSPLISSEPRKKRTALPQTVSPDEYWAIWKRVLKTVLEKWDLAFQYGGIEYKYVDGLSKIALASCKPAFALKAWSSYIVRYEDIVYYNLEKQLPPDAIPEAIQIPERAMDALLQKQGDYRKALNNYLIYYHIYTASLKTNARLKKQYPKLKQSSPLEAISIIERRLRFEKNRNIRNEIHCAAAPVYFEIYSLNLKPLSEVKSRTDYLVNSIQSYNYCLVTAGPFQEFESYLSLAEIYLSIGQKNLARENLNIAYIKKPINLDNNIFMRKEYSTRMDKVKFGL